MIDFSTTESQKMIADMVRDFAEKNIRPKFMEWDETQHFPRDLFRKMGELGLMGILVPQDYGGAGLSYTEYVT
ncbi:MAG: acyl-CoA dehydrogenase family protein, partial [Bacteroidia bacterium]